MITGMAKRREQRNQNEQRNRTRIMFVWQLICTCEIMLNNEIFYKLPIRISSSVINVHKKHKLQGNKDSKRCRLSRVRNVRIERRGVSGIHYCNCTIDWQDPAQ